MRPTRRQGGLQIKQDAQHLAQSMQTVESRLRQQKRVGGGGYGGGGREYLEGAEHGQEGLCNDEAEEQIAEGSHGKASRACLQGLNLRGV